MCQDRKIPALPTFVNLSIFSFCSQVASAEGGLEWGGDRHLPCPDGMEACGLTLCQACCRSFPEHPDPQQEGPSLFFLLPPPSPSPLVVCPLVSFLLQPGTALLESETHSLTCMASSGSPFALTRPLTSLEPNKYTVVLKMIFFGINP